MRVAILQPDSELYGAAKAMLQAVQAMPEPRPTFEAWFPYPGRAMDAYCAAGIESVVVPDLAVLRRHGGIMGAIRLLVATIRSRRVVRQLANRRGVDVLHSNSMVMLSGAAARLGRRRPAHVWQIREAPASGRLLRGGYRCLTRLAADHVVAVSAASSAFGPADTLIVPDGVRIGDPSPSDTPAAAPPSDHVVLMVARLLPTKGQDTLLRAFAPLADRHPRAQLWFAGTTYAGSPDHARALLALADELGIADRVSWLGYVDDVDDLYRRARTVVVATAAGEGFGLAALEAMAQGVPPIVAGAGGTTEIVTPNESGLVTTPGDTAALRKALDRMLGDDQLHERLAAGARVEAARFDITATAAALRDILMSVGDR